MALPGETRSMVIREREVVLRRAAAEELIDLRHRVLRAGLPRHDAIFPGDELPANRHFGAFVDREIVCCATFHREPYDGEAAWRLRGMATNAAFQGRGIGHALLDFAEDLLKSDDPMRLLWCNARIAAVPFYQSMGWTIVSELFDIPTAGPHHRMIKRMGD